MLALVASGANAAMPHYLGSDQPIERHSPLLVDIGAMIGAY
jgi:Xaa-Pro aminopeptidase